MGEKVRLILEIVDESTDAEGLDSAVRGLRRELVELDSVSTSIGTSSGGTGAKGDLSLLGTIAVSMISSAVPAMVALIGRWVHDRGGSTTSGSALWGTAQSWCSYSLVAYIR